MYDYLTITQQKGLQPITTEKLEQFFRKIGIHEGNTVLVHASLSALGYVIGGAEAVYEALKRIIGDSGTIVVPSQTVEISDPSTWRYPPVPEEWFDCIREDMPAFDPKRSFSKSMGQFSTFIGHLENASRSIHPMYSFAAVGRYAMEICDQQSYDFPFGESSPLAKLYDLHAKVVMIGTDFETNTCIHLAEHF